MAETSVRKSAMKTSTSGLNESDRDLFDLDHLSAYESFIHDANTKAVIKSYNEQHRGGGKLEDLLYVPRDNLSVTKVTPEHPEGTQLTPPDDVDPSKLELYIKESIRFFSQTNEVLKSNYKNYKKVKIDENKFGEEAYECDKNTRTDADGSNSTEGEQKAPIEETDPEKIVKTDMELLKSSAKDAKKFIPDARPNLFKMYDMATSSTEFDWAGGAEKNICKRYPKKPNFALKVTDPFLIEIKSLNFALTDAVGEIEPIFCSLALYDLTARKRISEIWNFDLNSDSVLNGLPTATNVHEFTKLRRAVFHVSHRHANIFLVMKISKVLQGEEDAVTEPYCKPEKYKKSDAEKLTKAVREVYPKLGQFRQPICWSSMRVFDTENEDELKLGKKCKFREFYRTKGNYCDETFMEMMNAMNENDSIVKKMKMVPATCEFDVVELMSDQPFVHKGNDVILIAEDDEAEPRLARDIREFPPEPAQKFFDHFVNYLYIQPESITYTSRGTLSTSSRNYTIEVQVKDNDDDLESEGLPVIYGGSSESLLNKSAFTSVTYHNKQPEFNDEFKIKLPTVLTNRHHVLFTFHDLTTKSVKKSSIVGHAVLPLCPEGRIADGVYTLSLYEYCSKKGYAAAETVKQSKQLKQTFKFNVRSESTIYPPDKRLSDFFRHYKTALEPPRAPGASGEASSPALKGSLRNFNSTALKRIWKDSKDPEMILCGCISMIDEVPTYLVVQYMPRIFNQLLRIICCPDEEVLQPKVVAFKTLLKLVSAVSTAEGASDRGTLLTTYIQDIFVNFKDAKHFLYNELIKQWLSVAEDAAKARAEKDKTGFRTHQIDQSNEQELPLLFSWFLFDLIHKSMALHLNDAGALQDEEKRSRFFPAPFRQTLESLVVALADEVVYRSGAGLNLAKPLNVYLALFLRDLFDVMDRGFVLRLIAKYLTIMTDIGDNDPGILSVLQELRISFLRVIVDYEHYVQLSFPLPYTIDSTHKLAEKLISDNFLCGILITQCLHDLTHKERTIRLRSMELFKDVLTKHDYDIRYQDRVYRERIASMYFPFVLMALDKMDQFIEVTEKQLKDLEQEAHKAETIYKEVEARMDRKRSDEASHSSGYEEELSQISEELNKALKAKEAQELRIREEKRRCEDEKKQLLICIMWVLKNMNRELLSEWWKKEVGSKLMGLHNVFLKVITLFEYLGKEGIKQKYIAGVDTQTINTSSEAKSALESMYSEINSAGKRTAGRKTHGTGGSLRANRSIPMRAGGTGGMRTFAANPWRTGGTLGKGSIRGTASAINSVEALAIMQKLVLWEGNLASELNLAILDIIIDFMCDYKDELISQHSDSGFTILDSVFSILTKFLQTNQSTTVLVCTFAALRYFLSTFRSVLFSSSKPFSETLCKEALRHCGFKDEPTRTHSASLLYSLIKNNYMELGNFARVKIQTTVALSNLVDEIKEEEYLRCAFVAIANYAKKDKTVVYEPTKNKLKNQAVSEYLKDRARKPSVHVGSALEEKARAVSSQQPQAKSELPFTEQVLELTARLGKTLLDNLKIKELERTNADSEVMADLYHRIANGYKHAPELSVTWFNNMAEFHRKNEKYIEAAECIMYVVAIVFEYMKIRNNVLVQNLKREDLYRVAPYLAFEQFDDLRNILEENKDNTFQSANFLDAGFMALLRRAADLFEKAEHYEYAVEVYKLIIPIYESAREYEALQEIHTKLASWFGDIIRANKFQSRLYGSFYRVGFYGPKLPEDLRGVEFIYKMPKITRLAEIKAYLESHFVPKYGEGKVQMIRESVTVDEKTLDPDCIHIQITSVKPYFTAEESKSRVTYFESNTNLQEFIFETAFTVTGAKAASLAEQCKRKTILTVERPLPYMKTRLRVVSKKEIILEPVYNAIEIIESSNTRIANAISCEPLNINTLQMALQGALVPQVNEGIPAIVNIFLKDGESKYPAEQRLQLIDKLRDFLLVCQEGIRLDKMHLKVEHKAFHEQLELGFARLSGLLAPILENASSPSAADAQQRKAVRFQD